MSTKKNPSRKTYWIHGWHAATCALANPDRQCISLLVTAQALERIKEQRAHTPVTPRVIAAAEFSRHLPKDAVHQGIAVEVAPLAETFLEDLAALPKRPLVVLDQVTDPHNVGAILRSAAAFSAQAVIVTRHHAPEESGVLAKSASGALEIVPIIRVANLVQALEALKKYGYWCVGLDGEAKETLGSAPLDASTALVLGAEGEGLRRLTREHCDRMVKIPITSAMESLNVSNAAAVALYEISRLSAPEHSKTLAENAAR